MISKCFVLETRGILTLNVLEILAQEVSIMIGIYPIMLPAITCAASLAHHGLLGSVAVIGLDNVDPTSVPSEHLASLVSSVTYLVSIGNVSGCDLLTILDTVRSKELIIGRLSLGSAGHGVTCGGGGAGWRCDIGHQGPDGVQWTGEMQSGEVYLSYWRKIQAPSEDLGQKQKLDCD